MDPKAVEALRILSRVLALEGRRFVLIGATVPQIVLDFRGTAGSGSRETRDLVVIRVNMAMYKSLLISAVSATVIPTEDGQNAQIQPVPNRALETGKRSLATPRAKIYVAVFRGLACQDDPACGTGTSQ